MTPIIKLVEILMSWPAITLWLGLVFRRDLARLLKRLQSIRLPQVEGSFKTRTKARE